MKQAIVVAVFLASALTASSVVSQTDAAKAMTEPNRTPTPDAALGLSKRPDSAIRDQTLRKVVGVDSNGERSQSTIAFTESLRVKANSDGTWLIDPRLLASGFLARTSEGSLITLFVEVTKNDQGEEQIDLKWRPSNEVLGSIVVSDGELNTIENITGGHSECLKSLRVNNFTKFFIEELVLGIRVDESSQTKKTLVVATSGVAERDLVSIEIPAVLTKADCATMIFVTEVKSCTFRNGISCEHAVVVDGQEDKQ